MTNLKHTKKALLSSIIALVLCFAMLLGTTYAWFTDSATSSGNKIQAGTLDVDLYLWGETGATEITDASDPIFGVNSNALAQKAQDNAADTLWEPGKTQTVYLSIKNNGNLDLKYKVAIDVSNATNDLEDYMEYAITPDAKYGGTPVAWAGGQKVVANRTNATQANNVPLKAGQEHFFALSVHMDELATNEQMGGTIDFDIKVLAGQLASELDSFGDQYDAYADYGVVDNSATLNEGDSAVEVLLSTDEGNNSTKVASVLIPSAAIATDANGTGEVSVVVNTNAAPQDNITIYAGETAKNFDVKVLGLVDNNTEKITVQLRIPAGLDPTTVKAYHYDRLLGDADSFSYNPNDGYVTFKTATFSPFTVVYKAESEYVAPEVTPEARPTATVTYAAEYVGENKITWGNFGQWSPAEGLEANLEAAFVFTCPETAAKAALSPYANWYCDFYVKLDKDLGENQIFLGGNYGSFGWVGFHNGDLTLEANNEIGLLEGVTTNPWTYLDVATYVGTFICGVGDVGNALDGATFTVMLRLTNPENESEFYDVNVVTHTFGGNSVIDGVTVDLDAN